MTEIKGLRRARRRDEVKGKWWGGQVILVRREVAPTEGLVRWKVR